TVAQAAALTVRSPQFGVSEPKVDRGTLPGVQAVGLTYPYWEDHFGFKAQGVRYDGISGRLVTTVFYRRGASRVAYEIVSGPPLRTAAKVRSTVRQGVRLSIMATGSGLVVSWLRD